MELYPAIDVRDGQSVRLVQGDFDRERAYGDPLATAEALVAAGARHLHVVDLDGARTGRPRNRAVIGAIARRAAEGGADVQAGGGVRDEAGARSLLESGVARVVVGTAALEQAGLVADLAACHPGRVVLGLDHRRGQVAVRGWREESGATLLEVLAAFEHLPLGAVVVTDISRDGMLSGPDLEGLTAVLEATSVGVIASGGVGSLGDLSGLAGLAGASGRHLVGAIVGMALREGRLSVEEAMATCAASG